MQALTDSIKIRGSEIEMVRGLLKVRLLFWMRSRRKPGLNPRAKGLHHEFLFTLWLYR